MSIFLEMRLWSKNSKIGADVIDSLKRHRCNISTPPSLPPAFHSFVTGGAKFETRGQRGGTPTSANREKVKWNKMK